jgi:predicted GH43/DUF377 family glycosyl hydrolase
MEIDSRVRPVRRGVTVCRVSDMPVVEAGAAPGYGPIFNAGVIVQDGVYHLFARGVRDGYSRNPGPGPRFVDYVSDVLVFTSTDGRDYAFQQVLAQGTPDGVNCYEDPRVQRVRSGGAETVVMTYTNLPLPQSGEPWRIGVHRLGYVDGRFFLNRTSGRVIGPAAEPNKDAVIFNLRDGRVALVHRVYPNIQVALFDSLEQLWADEPAYWDEYMRELDRHTIITPHDGALGVGAGAPPLEVDGELVFFFHERDRESHYTTKVALLDDRTGHVKAALHEPIMRPELGWEQTGDVDNVVFVQGAVLRADGTIYLTYGAADRCVGAAELDSGELLSALRAA